MINEILVWYLETNNGITEFQSGFRHQRSTDDHLVIHEAFIKKEHLVAVFFDLEKGYDTTNLEVWYNEFSFRTSFLIENSKYV